MTNSCCRAEAAYSLATIKTAQPHHISVIEGEVPNSQILRDTRHGRRLGQRHEFLLQVPSENDLRWRASVFGGNGLHHVIAQDPPTASSERVVALNDDPMRAVMVADIVLLEEGMHFELIDHRHEPGFQDEAIDMLGRTITASSLDCRSASACGQAISPPCSRMQASRRFTGTGCKLSAAAEAFIL